MTNVCKGPKPHGPKPRDQAPQSTNATAGWYNQRFNGSRHYALGRSLGIKSPLPKVARLWLHCLTICFFVLSESSTGWLYAQTPLPTPTAVAPTPTPVLSDSSEQALNAQIETLLSQLSSAEKVGQLFVVTFAGNDTRLGGNLVRLVNEYHVGGVVLSASRGNFSNEKGADTPVQVAVLVNQLQALAYGYLLPAKDALEIPVNLPWSPSSLTALGTQNLTPTHPLPLLIGVEQGGDGLPHTALRRGFTALPTQMALGATWNPALVRQVGEVVGYELRTVGVNLLLGPNLDVIDQPKADSVRSLGSSSFGGSAYWVSQLGRAYIAGIHQGANGRVATMAGHFPGQGSSDRLPDQEVATIQKSLEELHQVELKPFVEVTYLSSPSAQLSQQQEPEVTDGLVTSHMRYSVLQGNAPGNASPLSLTPELSKLVEQQGFADWHNAGGILMSNALGVPAIRRYYQSSQPDFLPIRAAIDAFNAGHDLLYLADLSPESNPATTPEVDLQAEQDAEVQTIADTLLFFQNRYNTVPAFAGQVDAALRRTLRLKLRLYQSAAATSLPTSQPATATPNNEPVIPLAQVLVTQSGLDEMRGSARLAAAVAVMDQVARAAITILYPGGLTDAPAAAPQASDHILIITDSRLARECPTCAVEAEIGPENLANIIEFYYGGSALALIPKEQVKSLDYSELAPLLNAEEKQTTTTPPAAVTPTASAPPTPVVIENGDNSIASIENTSTTAELQEKNAKINQLIEESTWIIFAMLNVDTEHYPQSDLVKRFLNQRSEQAATKHVIVFALNAPYFLDATEISQLSAYFGVYSKTQPFLENAVRALFRSYTPAGASPVSVPGTHFAILEERLQPDPSRQISLKIAAGENDTVILTPEGGPPPSVNVGETIRLWVGPIYDLNNHLVPDGTQVNFGMQYEDGALALADEPATTRSGLAVREVPLERAGRLLISARAGEATTGNTPIILSILDPGGGVNSGTPSVLNETGNPAAGGNAGATAVEPPNTPPNGQGDLPPTSDAARLKILSSRPPSSTINVSCSIMAAADKHL